MSAFGGRGFPFSQHNIPNSLMPHRSDISTLGILCDDTIAFGQTLWFSTIEFGPKDRASPGNTGIVMMSLPVIKAHTAEDFQEGETIPHSRDLSTLEC